MDCEVKSGVERMVAMVRCDAELDNEKKDKVLIPNLVCGFLILCEDCRG